MHGVWRDPQRGGGGITQAPNSPCRDTARHTQLTSPLAFQGWPDARVRTPQTILGLILCPMGQNGLGQSDSQGTSGHQGLFKATWEVCAPSVQEAGAGPVPGHVLPSPHPHASVPGHRGPVGCSAWPWKGCQDSRPLCCAQDYESEKPPRSRHRSKLPRVSLQGGAWVQVHPTQRSRDLDPETKRHSRFIGSVDRGICRNLHSHVGQHAGG